MNGYPKRKMWPCRECHEVGATHCTDPELCGGTCEYIRADIYEALRTRFEAGATADVQRLKRLNDNAVHIVAEKDAEIERLRKALEQAAEIVVRLGRDIYPDVTNQRYTCFDEWDDDNQYWGCGYTESPELAAYLRDREGKEGSIVSEIKSMCIGCGETFSRAPVHGEKCPYCYEAITNYTRDRVASGDNRPPSDEGASA